MGLGSVEGFLDPGLDFAGCHLGFGLGHSWLIPQPLSTDDF